MLSRTGPSEGRLGGVKGMEGGGGGTFKEKLVTHMKPNSHQAEGSNWPRRLRTFCWRHSFTWTSKSAPLRPMCYWMRKKATSKPTNFNC